MTTAETTTSGALDDRELEDASLPKMTFLEHLEEFRKRLIYSVVALCIGFIACWNFADTIFGWLEAPVLKYLPKGDHLAYTRLTSPFVLYMKVAFFGGLIVTSPYIILQLWLFISPGLYKRERRYAVPFIIFASLFFVGGAYFGYRFVFPMTCAFFVGVGKDFKQVITIDEYFSFASKMILGIGLVFETPILIFFLARLGIVTPKFLMAKFKYAVVLIFFIAAVITPTPDMVTQSMIAIPMIVLYALGILIAVIFGKKKVAAPTA